jgi:hypothetical protein
MTDMRRSTDRCNKVGTARNGEGVGSVLPARKGFSEFIGCGCFASMPG